MEAIINISVNNLAEMSSRCIQIRIPGKDLGQWNHCIVEPTTGIWVHNDREIA